MVSVAHGNVKTYRRQSWQIWIFLIWHFPFLLTHLVPNARSFAPLAQARKVPEQFSSPKWGCNMSIQICWWYQTTPKVDPSTNINSEAFIQKHSFNLQQQLAGLCPRLTWKSKLSGFQLEAFWASIFVPQALWPLRPCIVHRWWSSSLHRTRMMMMIWSYTIDDHDDDWD